MTKIIWTYKKADKQICHITGSKKYLRADEVTNVLIMFNNFHSNRKRHTGKASQRLKHLKKDVMHYYKDESSYRETLTDSWPRVLWRITVTKIFHKTIKNTGERVLFSRASCKLTVFEELKELLTLSWRRPLSHRNQCNDLQSRWTGFYMITASVMKELKEWLWRVTHNLLLCIPKL